MKIEDLILVNISNYTVNLEAMLVNFMPQKCENRAPKVAKGMMAALDEADIVEVRRLLDEAAIQRLLARYPRAVDRHDWKLLESLFFEDAIDEHGDYNGSAAGFVEHMRSRSRAGVHWMHLNGTQVIDIEGDIAWAETYTLAFRRNIPTDRQCPQTETFLRVRYIDRLERRKGEWRIAHRRVVYGPCQTERVGQDFAPLGAHIRDEAFPVDMAYAATRELEP